jgi:hypothetical protein
VVSVDGLLDAHEVVVRARLEALREQAARVAAQLGEAELALEHLAVTRVTLAAVLAGNAGADPQTQGTEVTGRGGPGPARVPTRRADLTEAHLPAEYRRVWQEIAGAPGPVRAQELAAVLGLAVTAAKVEGLRSKLKRLVARGWIAEPAPGAFALASTGSASPGVGP